MSGGGWGAGRRRERGSAARQNAGRERERERERQRERESERERERGPPPPPVLPTPHPVPVSRSLAIYIYIHQKRNKKHFFFRSECTVNNFYLVRCELTIFNGRLTLVLGGATVVSYKFCALVRSLFCLGGGKETEVSEPETGERREGERVRELHKHTTHLPNGPPVHPPVHPVGPDHTQSMCSRTWYSFINVINSRDTKSLTCSLTHSLSPQPSSPVAYLDASPT